MLELSRFKQAEIVWCQEEPKNMGAWSAANRSRARYAGRPASAATATGLMSKHLAQLKAFIDECLA
jgi:2-oxoglutarate dehydrogenase E1 component